MRFSRPGRIWLSRLGALGTLASVLLACRDASLPPQRLDEVGEAREEAACASCLVSGRSSPNRADSGVHPASASREGRARSTDGPAVGDRVVLQSQNALGVPLHPRARSSEVSGRLPSGTSSKIVWRDERGHWLEIEFGASRERAFIIRKYLASGSPAQVSKTQPPVPVREPSSRGACQARLRQRPPQRSGSVRVGSFNVRWFPDGRPGKAPPGPGTDVSWLACQIAELSADVIALQEFKKTARASQAVTQLRSELDKLSGGSWRAIFDDCPGESNLHVGLLFDEERLDLERTWMDASQNPLGSACAGSLRPGLAGRFRTRQGGILEVLSVHWKSGTDRRSYGLRKQIARAVAISRHDALRVWAGDLNSMGCEECLPAISADAERRDISSMLARASLVLVEPGLGCSHFYRGHPGLLDGFILPASGASSATARVGGACQGAACEPLPRDAPVLSRVSDHCPLVLELGVLSASALPSSLPAP